MNKGKNNTDSTGRGAQEYLIDFCPASESNAILSLEEDQALGSLVEHFPEAPTWEELRFPVIARAEEIDLSRGFIFRPRPLRQRLAAMVAFAAIIAVSVFSILMLSPGGREQGMQSNGSDIQEVLSAWHSDRGTSFQLASHP